MSDSAAIICAGKNGDSISKGNAMLQICVNTNLSLEAISSTSLEHYDVISEVDEETASQTDEAKSKGMMLKQQKRKADFSPDLPTPKRRKDNSSAVHSGSVYVVVSDADDDDAPKTEDALKVNDVAEKSNEVAEKANEDAGKPGEVTLTVKTSKAEYSLMDFLGKGSFGQVVKCMNRKTKEVGAMKMTTETDFIQEANIWQELRIFNAEKVPIVRVLDLFLCESRGYMVFELLEQSLLDFLRKRPIPIQGVCRIAMDLLTALLKLKEIGIVHTDIKPDNIMLVDHGRKPFSVKLIDFGLAIKKSRGNFPKNVQSLYYRAPEVLLDLPYNEAIDMWSVGCVVGAALTRANLYPGECEYEVMRLIRETHGIPPYHMLDWNPKASYFFCRRTGRNYPAGAVEYRWRLNTPAEYYASRGETPGEIAKSVLKNLNEAVEKNFKDTVKTGVKTPEDSNLRRLCTDLLRKMLQQDPKKRIYPGNALRHNFFLSCEI